MSNYWANQLNELNEQEKKKKKKKQEDIAPVATSNSSDYWGNQLNELNKTEKQKSINAIGVDTFDNDYKTVTSTISNVYSGWQDAETMKTAKSSVFNMYNRLKSLQDYNKTYGDGGVDFTPQLTAYKSVLDEWDSIDRTYRQYATADDYNKAVAEQKAQQEMLTRPLEEYDTEISTLETELEEAKTLEQKYIEAKTGAQGKAAARASGKYKKAAKKVEELETQIVTLKQNRNLAKRHQARTNFFSVTDAKSENYDADFEKYAQMGAKDENNKVVKELKEYDDYVNNYENKGSILLDFIAAAKGKTDYIFLEEDEIKLYNYYVAKDKENGTTTAKEFLKLLEGDIEEERGKEIAKRLKGDTFEELLFSLPVGHDQFFQGAQNLFKTEEDYIAPSGLQVAGSIIREDLADDGVKIGDNSIAQIVYDTGTTTANMAPALLTGAVANAVLPGSGTFVSSGLVGASASGNAYQQRLNEGWGKGEARTYSTLVGVSEGVLSATLSKVFGGKVISGKVQTAINGIDNALLRFSANYAYAFGSEFTEESAQKILEYAFENIALGYDKNGFEDIDWEEVAYEGLLGGFSGGNLDVAISAMNAVINKQTNPKLKVKDLTEQEKQVFDKVYENAVAEATKDGTELTKKQKTDIQNNILQQMEEGELSVDTINELFGGETYKTYKETLDQEQADIEELAELYEGDELNQQIENYLNASKRNELGAQLNKEVFEAVKDSRLANSFYEEAQRSTKFQADLSKYDAKQAEIVKKAVDSGILNNTKRTHKFVDMIAKIAADKGVLFDFANNKKIAESSFAVEGKTANGYVDENGNIVLNIDSSKALNGVVGHEITHILEGTELYDELQTVLFDYAKSRKATDSKFDNEYKERLYNTRNLYKNVDSYQGVEGFKKIKREVVADLVGDYLFTDAEFVRNLSVKHRNVFQKLYDEIKYLCKVATAGSKEARELERVKKAFEDAYRAEGKAETGTKHSLSYTTDNRAVAVIENDIFEGKFNELSESERIKIAKNAIKEFRPGIPVSGRLIGITRKSAGHFTNSDYTDKIRNNEQRLYEDKLNIVQNIDDVIYASTNYINEPLKHPRNDNINQFARGTVLLDIGGNKYEADVLVGYTTMQDMILYDVQDLAPTNFILKEKKAQSKLAGNESYTRKTIVPSNNIISQNSEKSSGNTKFSLSEQNEAPIKRGNYNVYGKDIALKTAQEEIAPIQEQATEAVQEEFAPKTEFEKAVADYVESNIEDVEYDIENLGGFKNIFAGTRQAYVRRLSNGTYESGTYGLGSGIVMNENIVRTDSLKEAISAQYKYMLENSNGDISGTIEKHVNNYDNTHKTTETAENMFPDNIAPTEELDSLLQRRNELESSLMELSESENFSLEEFDRLNNEYKAVEPRIAELESEEASRLNSIDDTDAPPEIDAPIYSADTSSIDDKALKNISAMGREILLLDAKERRMLEEVVQKYSTSEFKSESELFNEIKTLFGEKTFTERIEEVYAIQDVLRGYKIKVSPEIKRDINDYSQFMRSNFGKVTFSKDGLPVDIAYAELAAEYPHFFPEDISHPTDQLLQIAEVANMQKNETTTTKLDDDVIRQATEVISEAVNSYEERQLLKAVEKDSKGILRNEMLTRAKLHSNIIDRIKNAFKAKGLDLDNVLKKAKNLSTLATVDNTPQRVMEKSLGYKEGQILADETVNKVAQNETEGIKWLNSFTDRKNGLLAQISKQYNIKPGSKESAAAQMYAEGFYVAENNDIIEYGDAELEKDFPNAKVRANIKGLANDPQIRRIYDETLKMINESRIRNAYPEIPRLDNYFLHFRAMEDSFSRLGLPFNPNDIRAKDLPTDLNGVTADLKPGQPYFASAMHRNGKRTSFDLLGGLERYLSSAKNQIYHIDDIQTLRALRNYIADTYGQGNGLEGLDALSEEEQQERIQQVYGSHLSTFAKFLNEEANIIAGKTALIDRGIEGVLGRRAFTFLDTINKQVGSNMVGFNVSSSLTNFLAGVQAIAKTNKLACVKALAQTTSSKIGSIFGKTDSFVENNPTIIRRKGSERFYRTPYQKFGDAGYVLMSAVDNITTEFIVRAKYNEFIQKGLSEQRAIIEADKWTSRLMADRSLGQMPQLYNSKALGLITKFQLEVRNQLDSQFYDTIQEAKVSNEDINNVLARNAKTAAKVTATLFELAVLQHLFGKAFESVAGYNPAFDIIGVLITALGFDDEEESEDTALDNVQQGFLELLEDLPYASTFTGGRIPMSAALPDVKGLINGTDEYGNEVSLGENLWANFKEIAPYYVLPTGYGQIKKTTQGLSMFNTDEEHPIAGSYTDSGNLRFPVEDTLGNRIKAGLFGQYANENARDYFDNERTPLKEGQIQEYSSLGLSYNDYWTYRDDMNDISKRAEEEGASKEDIVKSKYINSIDTQLSSLRKDKLEILDDTSLTATEKEAKINEFDRKYNELVKERYNNYNNVSFDGDYAHIGNSYYQWYTPENGESYWRKLDESQTTKYLVTKDAGNANYATNGTVHYRRDEDGEWTKISDKQLQRQREVTRELGITPEEYWSKTEISFLPMSKGEYEYAFDNPENYAVAKAVGGYDAYKGYSTDLSNIKADKDENGKSISGSRKEKVIDYVNSLDIDYGERIILFKSEYNADDTYNQDIIDYLNGRDDISYSEMVTILKKLGFEVDDEGNIYW